MLAELAALLLIMPLDRVHQRQLKRLYNDIADWRSLNPCSNDLDSPRVSAFYCDCDGVLFRVDCRFAELIAIELGYINTKSLQPYHTPAHTNLLLQYHPSNSILRKVNLWTDVFDFMQEYEHDPCDCFRVRERGSTTR